MFEKDDEDESSDFINSNYKKSNDGNVDGDALVDLENDMKQNFEKLQLSARQDKQEIMAVINEMQNNIKEIQEQNNEQIR